MQFLAFQSSECYTKILAINHKWKSTFIHIKYNCEIKQTTNQLQERKRHIKVSINRCYVKMMPNNMNTLNHINKRHKWVESEVKLSNLPRNLSGTIKVSSGFNKAGYVTPALFFESWYNLFRPRSQPHDWLLLPTKLCKGETEGQYNQISRHHAEVNAAKYF